MKKKTTIVVSVLLVLVIIGCCSYSHFNPHTKLVGTWTGDGTWDLLGDSPFDGAVEITFYMDRTGYVATERGETSFTYDVQNSNGKWSIVILESADEYTYGQQFYIDGKTLNIEKDEGIVSFTRK